jgi:DNA-binding NtrC family response regulator
LEEQQIERLGGENPVTVDVRIIAATNRDLEQMVKEGRFRQDLFFRLNVFTIQLPALRMRLEDIPLLANHFLKNVRGGTEKRISSSCHRLLMTHEWPGNVRELKNAIESAAVLTQDIITPGHLPGFITVGTTGTETDYFVQDPSAGRIPEADETAENLNLDEQVCAFEKALIVEALTESHGVQVKAAVKLGIKERSLWHRLKKFQIDASDFKENS